MRIYRSLLTFIVIALTSWNTHAQTISGMVKDDKNIPIPGAVVAAPSSGKGTQTDMDGKFKLELTAGQHVIQITFIGFDKFEQTITLANGQNFPLDVVLKSNEITLENLEIVGYGIERNKPGTGAVSKIGG